MRWNPIEDYRLFPPALKAVVWICMVMAMTWPVYALIHLFA